MTNINYISQYNSCHLFKGVNFHIHLSEIIFDFQQIVCCCRWCTLAVCGCMYLAGLSMITEGGMYILQLVDNHSATYSALILGCTEISVMAWIYGVDQFLEDLKFMLGFYPYPRIYWKWAWKVISPTIVVVTKKKMNFPPYLVNFSADSGFHMEGLQR